jgi:adenylate cyclase
MFTDIVGFSALVQRDEAHAMRLLSDHNRTLRRVLKRFGGREVKTIGDAFLIEFPSALEAVRCSFALQQEIHEKNRALGPRDRMEIRVGIHAGDLIENEGDIFGDAVNISSRMEPLAPPGGVCISGQVFDQVRNKVDFPLIRMEKQKLKNIDQPIDVYRIGMPWEAQAEGPVSFDRSRVAVLPLTNMSPDPNDEYFADGITEEMITSLANIRGLTVIARTSVMQYKKTSKKASEIGRELNAGALIEGSVRKSGNRVRITVQLVNAADDTHLWAQNYDRQLDDVFAIQSEIAEKVAGELRVKLLKSEKERLEAVPTESTEAHVLYLKGRHLWNERSEDGMRKAILYFEEAIKKDPNFALGYSGLADCYHVMGWNGLAEARPTIGKAKQYALRALELDENLAEAHTTLAAATVALDFDFDTAELGFRRAIQLKPSYPTAHQWFAQLLGFQGRLEEGFEQISKALELDPLSLVINVNVGDSHYYAGRFDEAIGQFKKVIEMNPEFAVTYPSLEQAYLRKGMYREAKQAAETSYKLTNWGISHKLHLAYVCAAMGKREEARRLLKPVERGYEKEYIGPYNIALVKFAMGDNDSGFEWLQKAYEERDRGLFTLKIDYEFDKVRDDPRFLDLLEKIGLARKPKKGSAAR